MSSSRTALKILTVLGLVTGAALAYWEPQWPLLGYWLLFSTSLGIAVSNLPSLSGIATRAKWLMTINALVVAVALATTQIAARRAISSTHLQYRGVHVVGIDSFTVGAGDAGADIRLESVASTAAWSVRVVKRGQRWTVEPLAGIEQLRMSPGARSSDVNEFQVAQSTILTAPGDWVAIADPAGTVVDTLRLAAGRLESSKSNNFLLRPINADISERYRRQLRAGVALSGLDGRRSAPSAYERFVRVQEFSAADVVNGVRPSLAQRVVWSLPFIRERWLPNRPLLVAASPPYSLRGHALSEARLSFSDSALFEIRNGDVEWRFQLRTWRREPSADVGVALFFVRNPRPLDTPLPTGVSCRVGVACGAISLRRLPPPVAQVALDFAGFDPDKFGMLGRVQQDNAGYAVILPRHVYRVERGVTRPVAIPVTSFADLGPKNEPSNRPSPFWLLLSASGAFGDDMLTILLIGVGLALLLTAIYTGVASFAPRTSSAQSLDEVSLSLGVTAILALLLTRVIIGARVAFFAPFLHRSIQTAVGMWVAIAIVVVGLLSWSAWLPPLLTSARNTIAGQVRLRTFVLGFSQVLSRLWMASTSPPTRAPALFTVAALACLGIATPAAVLNGIVAGSVVLLAWVCLAWVAAFAGPYFETFERGAWSVVEQLAPQNRIASSTQTPTSGGQLNKLGDWCQRIPELPIILACLSAEVALLPRMTVAMAILAAAVLIATLFVIRRRRTAITTPSLPDHWGATAGAALFTLVIAALRLGSGNGSMAAFVLIVFVALACVRIGRSVGSRIEVANKRGAGSVTWGELVTSSALLIAPLALLAPLMVIDMGLFLVVVVPVGFATLLAAGPQLVGWRLAVPSLAFALLFGILAPRVLFPSMRAIREADRHAGKAAAFSRMTEFAGLRLPFVSTSLDRVAARSVATADRKLAEELLISAKPGPARDLLIPSIEQIWGGTTYASAGFWGGGLGQAVVGGRGVAESVSYAENTFAVFILAEHGAFGGLLVLMLYLLLTLAVAFTARTGAIETPASYRASRALLVVAALIVVIPAAYVAMSNLGVVPITGQNMPFLGLNAWSDVAICAGVVGILITGAIRRMEETVR